MASLVAGRSSLKEQLRKCGGEHKKNRGSFIRLSGFLFVRFLQSCKSRIGVTHCFSASCFKLIFVNLENSLIFSDFCPMETTCRFVFAVEAF